MKDNELFHIYGVNNMFDLGTFCAWVAEHYQPLNYSNKNKSIEEVYSK